MRITRRILAVALAGAMALPPPAMADYVIKDGNGTQQTIKAFTCSGSSICPGYVPMDLSGAQFGIAGNPFFVAPVQDVRPASGPVTARDTASSTATGQNGVSIVTGTPTAGSTSSQSFNGQGSARVQVTGTWTGTLTFEGSMDAGVTWVAQPARVTGTGYTQSNITANGMFLVDTSGLTTLRVRSTAAMTGTATVLFTFANNDGLIQIANPVRLFDNASGFSATVDSSGRVNVNCGAGCSGGGGGAITAASGAYAAGSLAAGAAVDGWNLTEGLTTDSAATAGGTGTFSAKFRLMTTQLAAINTTLGTPFQAGGSIGNTAFGATQSGTWTVQPGNTANTVPWLLTINQGGNSAAVTASNALKVDGSAVTQPVSGTVTANGVGGANFANTQVSVGSTATSIVAARTGAAGTGRISATVCNTTTTAIYLGGSGVTTSTGQYLAGVAGACATFNTTAAIYGIVATGTATVGATEVY